MGLRFWIVAILSPGCIWTTSVIVFCFLGARGAQQAGYALFAGMLLAFELAAVGAYAFRRILPHWIAHKEAEHWNLQITRLCPGVTFRYDVEPLVFPGLSRVVIDTGGKRRRISVLFHPVKA